MKENVKINTWYKRTDIDFINSSCYKGYSTHFHIIEVHEKTYKLDFIIRAQDEPPHLSVDQLSVSANTILNLVECSQQEIDLLLNKNKEYEIY